ncbi:MAG: glycosyltransferase [Phycisphaerae bacterium]|nr:glycosyltransferase [Phycisphaerae bacterium]MDD5380276.1 glycosyltransferase [Phycisphaerae bacterium]
MKKNRDYLQKRVLMICYYLPPAPTVGALRSGKFVKYLGRFGWHSEVLTAYRGGTKEYEGNQGVKIRPTIRINLDEVISKLASAFYLCRNLLVKYVHLFKSGKRADKNISTRSNLQPENTLGIATYIQRWLLLPDGQAIWILLALPKALWLARKCDVIYSSLVPYSAHILGLLIKKLTHKPWVADYRDEWTMNTQWFPPTRFHRWLGEKLDATCVRNARFVVNTTEVRTQNFIDKFGGNPDKYLTIHNGYDEQDVAPYRKLRPPTETLVMTSIGSLYGGRDAKPFLRAVARLVKGGVIERQKLNIKLIGGQNPDLIKEVEKLEINDIVQIVPRIPQEDAFMTLAQSHIAVLVGSGMEKAAMTTKVYEYAGMGKPILALVPQGPVHDFVSKCGGWCVDGSNEEEILKMIMAAFEQYKRGELQSYNLPEFIKKYERSALTGQLAYCFDGCIKRGSNPREKSNLFGG